MAASSGAGIDGASTTAKAIAATTMAWASVPFLANYDASLPKVALTLREYE